MSTMIELISDRFFNDFIHDERPDLSIEARAEDFKSRNHDIDWSVEKLASDFLRRV